MLELKDIISSVLQNSEQRLMREKQAQDMSKQTNEKPRIMKQLKKEKTEEEVMVGGDDTSDKVEKLASAVEYILDNYSDIMPQGPLSRALSKIANEPGKGAGSLNVTKSGKPKADYAKKDKMAVNEDPSTPKIKTDAQGKTRDTFDKKPGGGLLSTEPFVNKPSGTSKEASAYLAVLSKLAGEDVLKANIKAGGSESSTVKQWDSTQSAGTPKGHDQSGYGNENEKYIMTNQGAIDMTKRQAKMEYNKREVGRAFNEVNPSKDTVLDRAWTHGRDTAKLAGMETAKKIERLAKEEEAEEIAEEQIAPGIHQKLKKEKTAEKDTDRAHRWGVTGGAVGAGLSGLSSLANAGNLSALGVPAGTQAAGALAGGVINGGIGYGIGRLAHRLGHGEATGKELSEKVAEAIEQGCTCDDDGTCVYCKGKNAVMKKLSAFKRAALEGSPAPMPDGQDPGVAAQAGGTPPPGGPKVPPPPDCICNGMGTCLPCKKAQLAMIMQQAKGGQGGPGGEAGMVPSGNLPQDQPMAM